MNQQYPRIKGEFQASGTHFVSFWWAIFWKEALGVLAAAAMIWGASAMARAAGFSGMGLILFNGALVLALCGWFFYLMTEIFYAMLEKKFYRKRFQLIAVDKNGKQIVPELEHARALTWSFIWGHVLPLLLIVSASALVVLISFIFASGTSPSAVSLTSLFLGLVLSFFYSAGMIIIWVFVFSFYPPAHIFSRPFYNLAGFRLAFVIEKD